MAVKWIDTAKLSFNSLLLLDKIQIGWMRGIVPELDLAIALTANPEVLWFLQNKAPEIQEWLNSLPKPEPGSLNPEQIRAAELAVMDQMNDWLTYVVDPPIYDAQDFLNWDSNELLSLADFSGKTVLDIGAGTGRLAFTVISQAKIVYAVEPIDNLRWYMRQKAKEKNLTNFYAVDGLMENIPFESNFADIIMAGHTFGDNPNEENAELERVTKNGGGIILCPGNNDQDNPTHHFLLGHGYSFGSFAEPTDGMKRKYWKINNK